jgi:hypothetical protein
VQLDLIACACGCGTLISPVGSQGKPKRYVSGHNPKRVAVPPEVRFWAFVRKTDSCWLWTGNTLPSGHGVFGIRRGVSALAHRFAWHLLVGSIPDGACVLHNCPGGDNPACVNPAHLWLGTRTANNEDAARKQQTAAADRHWNARLTASAVAAMRAAYAAGVTQGALARQYGVRREAVHRAIHGKSWARV